jgi:hypothetical protein
MPEKRQAWKGPKNFVNKTEIVRRPTPAFSLCPEEHGLKDLPSFATAGRGLRLRDQHSKARREKRDDGQA